MEYIPNDETGEALRQLLKNGTNLSKPIEVDFFLAAPSEEAGNQIGIKAEYLGFKVSIEQDEETGDWTCYCTKTIIPEYADIVRAEKQLTSTAQIYGGHMDGFGSYGNAP